MNSRLGHLLQTVKDFSSTKKIADIRAKTQENFEQKLETLVDKLLKNQKLHPVSEEERKEVVHLLFSKIDKHNYAPSMSYIKTLFKTHGTNNLKKVLQIKENIAKNLVEDAKARIKSRNVKHSKKTNQN